MGTKLGPRKRVEWSVRRDKKDVKAYSYVPETIVKKLDLTESKAGKSSKTLKDLVKKNSKGRRYPVGRSQSIGSEEFEVDLGTRTAKGNRRIVSLIGPEGATLSEAITLVKAGGQATRVRIKGNQWIEL